MLGSLLYFDRIEKGAPACSFFPPEGRVCCTFSCAGERNREWSSQQGHACGFPYALLPPLSGPSGPDNGGFCLPLFLYFSFAVPGRAAPK